MPPKRKTTRARAEGKAGDAESYCTQVMHITGKSTLGAALAEAERLGAIDFEAEAQKLEAKRKELDLREQALEKRKRETPETPLRSLLENHVDDAILDEPFASMALEEMDTLVLALTPGNTLDRRQRALAFARHIVRTLETHERAGAIPLQVLLAVEAVEKAYAHFRPPAPAPDTKGNFAHAERMIEWLDWGKVMVLDNVKVKSVDAALRFVASALVEVVPTIPAARWIKALETWCGETPPQRAKRGRPKRGAAPYYWHRILFELLTGSPDALDAERFRDNLIKYRREHDPDQIR